MQLDHFFIGVILLVVISTSLQFRALTADSKLRQQLFPDYPHFLDLWRCVVVALVLLLFQFLWTEKICYGVAERAVVQSKWPPRVREMKVHRFAVRTYQTLYFMVISAYSFFVLRNYSTWLVPALGGQGGEEDYFIDYPLQFTSQLVRWIFYLNGGYQLSSLILLLAEPMLPDFYENLLLHICGILLIFFSYICNFIRVGTVIMFCHDVCDIFSCACKSLVDTNHKYLTLSFCHSARKLGLLSFVLLLLFRPASYCCQT